MLTKKKSSPPTEPKEILLIRTVSEIGRSLILIICELGATVKNLTAKLNSNSLSFEKTTFSCCSSDCFNNTLQKTSRKQVVIIGQETHICILQTALDLIQQGYQVHIIEDAVCSRKIEHKIYALQRMQQQGATISNFESVLFEWLKHSKHQHFATISQLLCY